MAGLLESLDRLEEAEAAGRRALAIQPRLAEAACTLASALHAQGRVVEALEQYNYALEIKPNLLPLAHSKALFCEQYRPDVTLAGLADGAWPMGAKPRRRTSLDLAPLRQPARPRTADSAWVSSPPTSAAIRLVPFSSAHSSPSTVRHASSSATATAPSRDDLTRRIAAACDTWRPTWALGDEALAEQIRADRIDILFDLAGHTGQRLMVFARKPAPLQVSWIGYVGTTGLAAMDYLIADRFHVPPGSEAPLPRAHHPASRRLRLLRPAPRCAGGRAAAGVAERPRHFRLLQQHGQGLARGGRSLGQGARSRPRVAARAQISLVERRADTIPVS